MSRATDFFASLPAIELKYRAAVMAHHIKTPQNIGQILRIAANAHCDEVILTYKLQKAANRLIKRTAVSSFGITPFHWLQAEKLSLDIMPKGKTPVIIETTPEAKSLYECRLPDNPVFILGNESHGLDTENLEEFAHKIYIPMPGKVVSMNVTNALSVVLFEWLRQQLSAAK